MKDYEPDRQLKQYLLGALPPDQQERLEEQLLTDGAYVEQLAMVEEELLDSYVSQELSAQEREHFETYFLVTPERQRKLRTARALRKYVAQLAPKLAPKPAPKPAPGFLTLLQQWVRQPSWSVAVPALLVVFIGVFAWRVFFSQSELDKGLAALNAAYREQRPVESRIASFGYAPFIVTRGESAPQADAIKVKLAERILLDQADQLKNAAAFYALGKLHLSHRKFDEAIQQFEAALKTDPNNAQLHNDLAAALMERALLERTQPNAGQSLETFAQSREHLEKALQLDSRSLDARFNLALWQQRQRLWAQAEESWQKYLEQDSRSRWADDARQYLKEAQERKTQVSKTKEQLLKEFLQAHQGNDPDQAWRVLSQNREAISEKLIWWLLTDELLKPSSDYSSEQLRQALTFAGELEAERADDHFTAALAKYYRSLSSQQREHLTQAHVAVKEGARVAQVSNFKEAIVAYEEARQLFARTGNRWEASFTDLLLGQCHSQNKNHEGGKTLLLPLARRSQTEKHQWLSAQAAYVMGQIKMAQAAYTGSINESLRGLEISQKIDDPSGQQRLLVQLANQHTYLGEQERALTLLQQCQDIMPVSPPNKTQLWRFAYVMAQVMNEQNHFATAADYQKESLRLAQGSDNPSQLYLSYARLGNLYGKLQNYELAIEYAQRGLAVAQSRSEQKSGQSNQAYAFLQLGNLYRQAAQLAPALASYDQAFRGYDALQEQVRISEVHKGRLLCYLAQGDDAAAQQELQSALEYAEKYRDNILDEQQKNTFFDAGQSVYDIAIDFAFSRQRNAQTAFEHAETSRARSLLSAINPQARPYLLPELQHRLPPEAQLIQYAVLADKTLIWVISKSAFHVVEQTIAADELQRLAQSYYQLVSAATTPEKNTTELRQQATKLYQLLVSPIEAYLRKEAALCIIPDKILCALPFAALISPHTGTYLLQDYQISFAPSATTYMLRSESARQFATPRQESLLSVGNPKFDRVVHPTLPDLPAAQYEAEQIAKLYGTGSLSGELAREAQIKKLLAQADVVHLASHYLTNNRVPLQSQLLLAQEPPGQSEDGILEGQEIYARKLPHTRLTVLSACRSGIERYYNGEGMIGMARTFLAAGVPLVVASLWPVESQATAQLMIRFHQHRKQAGCPSAEALRRAQLEMLNDADARHQSPYYWASFAAIGGHTNY